MPETTLEELLAEKRDTDRRIEEKKREIDELQEWLEMCQREADGLADAINRIMGAE